MACADSPIGIWRVQEEADTEDQAGPLIKYYQPLKPLRAERRPLHALLGTAPAVLGSILMVDGLFSVAVEIALAITLEMTKSLYVLLRISFLTGPFFFGAGLLTNLLCKNPRLLPVCYFLNLAGVVMATLEVVIISVDFTRGSELNQHLKLELMEMCVMGLNLFLSLVLCVCIRSERNRHKQFLSNI
ncbi:unnamed protein product [Gadus morhua 'NCC']